MQASPALEQPSGNLQPQPDPAAADALDPAPTYPADQDLQLVDSQLDAAQESTEQVCVDVADMAFGLNHAFRFASCEGLSI